MKRKASRERGERDEDGGGGGGGGGVVGRPVAERKGLLLRLDCSLSGDSEAAHSDRIWSRPVQRLHLRWNRERLNPRLRCQPSSSPAPVPAEVNWH